VGIPLSEVVRALEGLAPRELAEGWDRPGLQVGDPDASVEGVLVCLDPSRGAVAQALRARADLLVSHHPLFLEPLHSLDLSDGRSAVAAECLRAGLALYACHTNLDRADGGVNDLLAKRLGLLDVRPLLPGEALVKLVVTVPIGYEPRIRRALAAAGGGQIGNYAGCSFGSRGTGTFRPLAGADPFLGEVGREEFVEETRLETVVPRSRATALLEAVLAAHPYEEPALDLFALEGPSSSGSLGRLGRLARPLRLAEWGREVASLLGVPGVRLVGDPQRTVEGVAVCGGSGSSLWRRARAAGAECLVTGDVKYHTAREAEEAGFSLVDAGHWATEHPGLEALTEGLAAWARREGRALRVEAFLEPDAFRWVAP
jgi:dinuclear metal center YbgI/SA1388 family protein